MSKDAHEVTGLDLLEAYLDGLLSRLEAEKYSESDAAKEEEAAQ